MKGTVRGTLPYFLGMDLAELAEGTPLTEEGGVVEFIAEATALEAALKGTGIDLSKSKDQLIRAVFLMRCFYLLGVFRGGEAARAVLLDEKPERGQFVLSRACALRFLQDLSGMSSFMLWTNCKKIGL